MKKLIPLILLWALSLSAFAAKVTLPPIIVGDYIITKADSVVENQAVIFADGARLVFEGNRSQIRYCKISGKGKVVFWNLKDGVARENTFENSGGVQLHCSRTPGFKAIGNRFLGQNNSEELFVIEPGHQWQFPDADKYGFKYNPSSRYERGQNRLQLVNRLNEERRGNYDGGKIVKIVYGERIPTFKYEVAYKNKWIVWQADNVVHELTLNGASPDGVWLFAEGLKPGPFRYATWNPEALIPGILVAKNVFSGPGQSSGFSGYGLTGAIVEDNFAAGFSDMGLDLEVGERGAMRRNVCVANQAYGQAKYWNQMEIVAPLGVHWLGENSGIVGETTWFYPQGLIESDRTTRKPRPEWSEFGNSQPSFIFDIARHRL